MTMDEATKKLAVAILGALDEAIKTAEAEGAETLKVPTSHAKLLMELLDKAVFEAIAGRGAMQMLGKLATLNQKTQAALDAYVELYRVYRGISVIGISEDCDDDQDDDDQDDDDEQEEDGGDE